MLIYTELGAKENGIEEGNIIHLSYTYLYILFLKKAVVKQVILCP